MNGSPYMYEQYAPYDGRAPMMEQRRKGGQREGSAADVDLRGPPLHPGMAEMRNGGGHGVVDFDIDEGLPPTILETMAEKMRRAGYDPDCDIDVDAPPPRRPVEDQRSLDEGSDGRSDRGSTFDERPPATWDPHIYDYPVTLQVRNTFFEMAARSPSLDEFMQERKVQSGPAAYNPGDEGPPTGYDGHSGNSVSYHSGYDGSPGGYPHRQRTTSSFDHEFDEQQPRRPAAGQRFDDPQYVDLDNRQSHRFEEQHRPPPPRHIASLDEQPPIGYDGRPMRPQAGRQPTYGDDRPSASREAAYVDNFNENYNRDNYARRAVPTNSASLAQQLSYGNESRGQMMPGYSSMDRPGPNSSAPPWGDLAGPRHVAPPPRWLEPPDSQSRYPDPPRSSGMPMPTSGSGLSSACGSRGGPEEFSRPNADSLPPGFFVGGPAADERHAFLGAPTGPSSGPLAAPVVDDPLDFSSDDEDGERINSQLAELGSVGCPTIGSRGHSNRMCRPCAFAAKGCQGGVDCVFCHLCQHGEKKRRKKEKIAFRRELQKWRQNGRSADGNPQQDKKTPQAQPPPQRRQQAPLRPFAAAGRQ